MTSIQRGLLPIGSGERIRTTDLRVMSPTSYHCSTPRYRWRTDLVSHKATLQYLQRWSVSRPGSGWDGVGPLRFMHANGSELDMNELSFELSSTYQIFHQGSPQPCALVASTCHHASSSSRLSQ